MLMYMIKNGKINLPDLQQEIMNEKEQSYLNQHPYDIWQGNNDKWYTYLPDKEKGRVLKKRNSEVKIKQLIIDYYKSKTPTLEEVFVEWSNDKLELGEVKKGTYDRYNRDFNRFFGDEKIKNLKFESIDEDWLESFIKKTIVREKLTRKSYCNLRLLLHGIFKRAKKKKLTQIDIVSYLKCLELSKNIFSKKIVNKEEQVFSEDEIPKVIDYLENNLDMVNLGLLLIFATGIRVGELAAIKPEDIIGNMLHVQRTEICYVAEVDSKTGKTTNAYDIEEYPKSEAGDRYAVIPDESMWIINMAKQMNLRGEFLFMRNGERIKTFTYRKRIVSVCNALHIIPRSPHKIRKTYGTMLIDADVDESIIIDQMGHNDINCTRQYYFYSNKNNNTKTKQINRAAIPMKTA